MKPNPGAASQTVCHLHFHILPRFAGLEFKLHARVQEAAEKLSAHVERIRQYL